MVSNKHNQRLHRTLGVKMIEHEQLLKLAEDEDDYPVMLYSAKKNNGHPL